MEINVALKSYNQYGGHPSISLVGEFLQPNGVSFGQAIQEIELLFAIPSVGPPRKTLESIFERHREFRESLPYIKFRRSSGKVEITVASNILTDRDWKPPNELSLPLFHQAVEEAIHAFSLLHQRLKKADAFDLERFLTHCQAAQRLIPDSQEDLEAMITNLTVARKARFDALSPWEKLDVEWDDFHSQSREVLNDPFYWDCTDGFAPHGNDTGADLLEDFKEWYAINPYTSSLAFWNALIQQWGYASIDEVDERSRWEGLIALAFAEVKMKSSCSSPVKNAALEAIAQYRADAQAQADWKHKQECLNRLDLLETKLRSLSKI